MKILVSSIFAYLLLTNVSAAPTPTPSTTPALITEGTKLVISLRQNIHGSEVMFNRQPSRTLKYATSVIAKWAVVG